MPHALQDKVTLITGASSGMGAAIARRFSGAGSKLVLSARRIDRIEALRDEITDAGGSAIAVQADVAQYAQMERLARAAGDAFGHVDILVNSAGFGKLDPFLENAVHDIDSQIDVNVKGVIYGCRAVLPGMIERKSGHIINIGSIASVRHFANFAVYTAAKFAVLGFSRSLYEEVRTHGIRVNCLCPAAVNTEFLDVAGFESVPWQPEDMLQAEDIAELAFTCVTMPPRVQIESMVIWPTCQQT